MTLEERVKRRIAKYSQGVDYVAEYIARDVHTRVVRVLGEEVDPEDVRSYIDGQVGDDIINKALEIIDEIEKGKL